MIDKPNIVCIVGPTASGKTGYAIELAKQRNGEIVSCDSMQIYKYMNIGTAKATEAEQAEVPHHMIDFVHPNTNYSVADFAADATECINDILSRGKLPILCGGTGLYIDAITKGIEFSEQKRDDALREELWQMAERDGAETVHKLLAELDPEEAEKVHPNNIKRVIRAIEICKTSGMSKTEADRLAVTGAPYNAEFVGLSMDREILYDRINRRVDIMMEQGLLCEVEELLSMNIRRESTAMQAIGYKEIVWYIDGRCSLCDAVDTIKRESRRYAKRQITWFKRNRDIRWIER